MSFADIMNAAEDTPKTLYSLKWEVVDSQNKVRGDLKLNMSP